MYQGFGSKIAFYLPLNYSRVHALQITRGPQNADYLSCNHQMQVNALQSGKAEDCVTFLSGHKRLLTPPEPQRYSRYKNTLSALRRESLVSLMSDTTLHERYDGLLEADKKPAKPGNQINRDVNAPDGGWGWVVCLGALMVNFLTVGQQNSAGVVYSALLNEHSSQRGETGEFVSISTCFTSCPNHYK